MSRASSFWGLWVDSVTNDGAKIVLMSSLEKFLEKSQRTNAHAVGMHGNDVLRWYGMPFTLVHGF
jgi:hypothetical protein